MGCHPNCMTLERQLQLPLLVTRAQILHRASSQHDHRAFPLIPTEESVLFMVPPPDLVMIEAGAYPSLLIISKISSEKQELYYYGLDDSGKEGNIYCTSLSLP